MLKIKRNKVIIGLQSLKEKEQKSSRCIDKLMLLSRATDKLNQHLEMGHRDFDLVKELDDDEANVSLRMKQPLYRALFPEWGRITA